MWWVAEVTCLVYLKIHVEHDNYPKTYLKFALFCRVDILRLFHLVKQHEVNMAQTQYVEIG